jgi:hypothetical protein
MALLMGHRQGTTGPGAKSSADILSTVRTQSYLHQVLFVRHPPASLGDRNYRELLTLSQAVDAVLDGDLALAGDTLMQRMKGIDLALTQSGWGAARHLELIPESTGMMSREEQTILARSAVRAKKVSEALK